MLSIPSITVLTLFPEMFPGPLEYSLIGKALKEKKVTLNIVPLRNYAQDRHKSVDDTCYGGGPGMVMRPDVIDNALNTITKLLQNPRFLFLTPCGIPLKQHMLFAWKKDFRPLIILCGRYEGVDQRVIDFWKFEEISIADIVVCGGEIPAMLLIESFIRVLEGVVGNPESLEEESFSSGLLEYPQYTRPQLWKDNEVPEVLLSGHHKNIKQWRYKKSCEITKKRRPDLWENYLLYGINKEEDSV